MRRGKVSLQVKPIPFCQFQYPQPRNYTEVVVNQAVVTEENGPSYGVCNNNMTKSEYGVDESEGYAVRNHKYYWMFVFG